MQWLKATQRKLKLGKENFKKKDCNRFRAEGVGNLLIVMNNEGI
jgi:hypothetical protein